MNITKTRDDFFAWLAGIAAAVLSFAALGALIVLIHTLLG